MHGLGSWEAVARSANDTTPNQATFWGGNTHEDDIIPASADGDRCRCRCLARVSDGRHGGGTRGRLRPGGRARLLRAVVGRHQVLEISGQERPVPHRAGQRLHRQYLAHPDDPDRQGLCGAARRRRQAEGVQGGVDRRGRAGADLGDQQLHRFRLRRHRRRRAKPDRLRAGHQARQAGRRHPRRLRQHSRHHRRHQRQRRPEGPRRAVGQVAGRPPAQRRQGPRGARRRRHVGRYRPPQRHPRDASMPPARSGT